MSAPIEGNFSKYTRIFTGVLDTVDQASLIEMLYWGGVSPKGSATFYDSRNNNLLSFIIGNPPTNYTVTPLSATIDTSYTGIYNPPDSSVLGTYTLYLDNNNDIHILKNSVEIALITDLENASALFTNTHFDSIWFLTPSGGYLVIGGPDFTDNLRFRVSIYQGS